MAGGGRTAQEGLRGQVTDHKQVGEIRFGPPLRADACTD